MKWQEFKMGMKSFVGVFGLALLATAAHGQTTNCQRLGTMTNCTTMGSEGATFTNCQTFGGMTSCNSTPPPSFSTPSVNTAAANSYDSAAAAGTALGLLIFRGARAVHEHRQHDRALRMAALIQQHDCAGAVALAAKENDHEMAARVPGICKTIDQAGSEPAFLANPSPDQLVTWIKVNVPAFAAERFMSVNNGILASASRVGPKPGSIWVHLEAFSPEGASSLHGRSSLQLTTFDCLAQSFGVSALTVYPGNSLSGLGVSTDKPLKMDAVRPGSVAEQWGRFACAPQVPVGGGPVAATAVTLAR